MDDIEQRSINDYGLVAYLQVKGIKQSSLPNLRGNSNSIFFTYKRTPELEKEVENFYLRQTQVDALSILEAAHSIRVWAGEIKRSRKGGGFDDGK